MVEMSLAEKNAPGERDMGVEAQPWDLDSAGLENQFFLIYVLGKWDS